MYLIQKKGVGIAVNREIAITTVLNQLPDLDDRQVEMVAEYIWGLKTAEYYLGRF